MVNIDKTIYYYLIMFAIFLSVFAFIPLTLDIIQKRLTINIPFSTMICFFLSFVIYLFISLNREYYVHAIFYTIGIIATIIIMFMKKHYDQKKLQTSVIAVNQTHS